MEGGCYHAPIHLEQRLKHQLRIHLLVIGGFGAFFKILFLLS